MVEQRTLPFMSQLKDWLQRNPGNVAISCHGNSMRPIRRLFEQLSLKQMLQIENPQDKAVEYVLHRHEVSVEGSRTAIDSVNWEGLLVPSQVRLATDPRNPLRKYY
jgi:bisphosphoglycerate-dependent phosphoglycerate mutase